MKIKHFKVLPCLVMCGNFTTKTYNISTEGNTSSSSTPTLQELWETEGSLAKAARIVQIAWRTILNKIGIPQVEAQLHKSLFFSIKSGKDIFWFESDRLGKNTWILLIMRPAYVSTCHFATQDSLLRTTTRTSSTCTGAYTSEMSLAVIQKTINESKALSFNVCFRPVSAHET